LIARRRKPPGAACFNERGGESQQVKVRHILRTRSGQIEPVRFQNADRIGPETMTFRPNQQSQYVPHARQCQAGKRISGLAEDTQTSVFRNRACCPSVLPVLPEPRVRDREIRARDQSGRSGVDIQQAWFRWSRFHAGFLFAVFIHLRHEAGSPVPR
jgi:hypothetical protein